MRVQIFSGRTLLTKSSKWPGRAPRSTAGLEDASEGPNARDGKLTARPFVPRQLPDIKPHDMANNSHSMETLPPDSEITVMNTLRVKPILLVRQMTNCIRAAIL
jgi:hypothetical protein